ncbi:MAG: PAS domain S-box protein [Verrucomicrobiota bacterium]
MTSIITKSFFARWRNLIYIMVGRLLFLMLLLFAVTMIIRFREEESAFYVFMAVAFFTTIMFSLWLRHEETLQATAPYQFILDVILITGIVHFTGGVYSELVLLYPLAILVAGIVISGQMAVQVSIMSIFCYATLVVLEYNGVLIYRGSLSSPYPDIATVSQLLLMRILIFSLFTAGVSYLSDKCLVQNRQLSRLRMIGDSILDNLNIPLLSVKEDGTIVKANQAVAALMGESVEGICGNNFTDLFPNENEKPDLINSEDARYLWHLKRADGEMVPITFEANQQSLPPAMFGTGKDTDDDTMIYLVALREMPEPTDGETEPETDTWQAATGTVTEMAHVLKNPLTAIRGAGELLNNAVDSIFQRSNRITESDWRLVQEMVSVIFQQTNDLDEKVRYYLECAEHHPAEFEDFIKNADKWSKRVLNSNKENPDEQDSDSR